MGLELRVVLGAVDRLSAPLKKVASSTSRLKESLSKGQVELARLDKAGKDVELFRKLKSEVPQSSAALKEAKDRAAELAKQYAATETPTRKLTKQFNTARAEVNKLQDAHQQQIRRLQEVRTRLSQAGFDTRNLSQATRKIKDDTARYNQELAEQKQRLDKVAAANRKIAEARERMSKTAATAGKFGVAAAGAAGIAYGAQRMTGFFLDPALEIERAKGALASVGVKNLDLVAAKGREMSAKLAGVTTASFVAAAYDIKSGISTLTDDGVAAMTASATLTAKATRALPEQMTSLFATGYGIFKRQFASMSDAEFGNMFSASLAKAVEGFKTTGPALQQAIESTGAGATNAGMPLADQLTALGLMMQTMQPGKSGTALKAFATAAAKAHAEFAKLAEDSDNPIEVRILDENNQLRALPDILASLRERYGEVLDATESEEIKKAFGRDEAKELIDALWGQEAAFRANAAAQREAAKEGETFTARMAALIDNNAGGKWDLLLQHIALLKETIGERLLPVVERLSPRIIQVVDALAGWIERNPKLATGLGAVVVAIGSIAAVAAPLLTMLSALIGSWAMFRFTAAKAGLDLVLLATKAFPAVLVGVRALSMALLTNPIGLAITAIAIAAGVVIKYWEPIKGFFAWLWEGIKKTFTAGVEFLKTIFENSPLGLFVKGLKMVSSVFGGETVEAMKRAASPAQMTPIPIANTGSGIPLPPSSRETSIHAPITIHAAPGMDEYAVGRQVRDEIRRIRMEDDARYRQRLHD